MADLSRKIRKLLRVPGLKVKATFNPGARSSFHSIQAEPQVEACIVQNFSQNESFNNIITSFFIDAQQLVYLPATSEVVDSILCILCYVI